MFLAIELVYNIPENDNVGSHMTSENNITKSVYICVGKKKHIGFSNSIASYSTNAECCVLFISIFKNFFF